MLAFLAGQEEHLMSNHSLKLTIRMIQRLRAQVQRLKSRKRGRPLNFRGK